MQRVATGLALVVLGGLACATRYGLGIPECPGPAPADAARYPRYDADSIASLAGTYEFIELDLAGGPPIAPQRARLVLTAITDSVTNTKLRGTATWLSDVGHPQQTLTVLVESDGTLQVGDAATYRIMTVNRHGLWGLYERPLIEHSIQLVDTATGRALPDPAGVFCAIRTAGFDR